MMTTNTAENILVVVQLTGGNDFMNTVVPYTNRHSTMSRKKVVIREDQVLPINDQLGINAHAAPFKRLYDEGKMAIVQGIGYPNSNRSHFRGMDIWHTCEPDQVGSEGWAALAVQGAGSAGRERAHRREYRYGAAQGDGGHWGARDFRRRP